MKHLKDLKLNENKVESLNMLDFIKTTFGTRYAEEDFKQWETNEVVTIGEDYAQAVNKEAFDLLTKLREGNMCSHYGDELIDDFFEKKQIN